MGGKEMGEKEMGEMVEGERERTMTAGRDVQGFPRPTTHLTQKIKN